MVSINFRSSLFISLLPHNLKLNMNLMLEDVFVVSLFLEVQILKLNISESGAGFPSCWGSASRTTISRIDILIICWRRRRRYRRHASTHAQRIWRKNWKLGWRGGRRRQVVVVKLGGVGGSGAGQSWGVLLTGCPRYTNGRRAGVVEAIRVQVVLRIWKINILIFDKTESNKKQQKFN